MATEQEIHTWLAGYPRDWNQLCQALMWQLANRFGTVVATPGSAIDAYRVEASAGRVGIGTPPAGTYVYWDIGAYGHVGFMMNDGRILMATSHLAEQWVATDAGWNTLDAYVAATGARYLGWSWQNAGNVTPFDGTGSSTSGGETEPLVELEDDMIHIIDVDRGTHGIIGPGYYYWIPDDEHLQNAGPICSKTIEGNARQYDLWVAMALQGSAAKMMT